MIDERLLQANAPADVGLGAGALPTGKVSAIEEAVVTEFSDAEVAEPQASSSGHLDLEIQNLPLDNRLHKSLPPEWQALFDVYNPSGSVDVAISLGSHNDGQWRLANSVLTARGCRIRHTKFPYPLEQVTGTLTQPGSARDLVVVLDAVAGGQPIALDGRARGVAQQP